MKRDGELKVGMTVWWTTMFKNVRTGIVHAIHGHLVSIKTSDSGWCTCELNRLEW